jgi:hypothetical protein
VKHVRLIFAVFGLSVALAATFGATPARAHHSFGFYDMQKTTQIDGTVEKYEWSNPHSWLFLAVPSPDGMTVYGFEMVSVGELLRRGWAKNSIKPGDKIKVTFHPMRDGSPNGLLMSVSTAEGVLIGRPPPAPSAPIVNPPANPAAPQ